MSKTQSKPSLIHAIFLVSGTSIGAGMLAQPVASSLMGFGPSTLMMVVSWAFMAATALILVEVCLWMPKGSHVISMANHFLGPIGKVAAWCIYLFMAYLSLTAYISGGGDILQNSLSFLPSLALPDWAWCLIFVLGFGIVIEISNNAVSRLNTILFCTLVLSYLTLIVIGFDGIRLENLTKSDFSKSYVILPLLLASFSFQMIVPSLVDYLQQDRKRLRMAIISWHGCFFRHLYTLEWNCSRTRVLFGRRRACQSLRGRPSAHPGFVRRREELVCFFHQEFRVFCASHVVHWDIMGPI
jgi:tyrosine-specific transport protein